MRGMGNVGGWWLGGGCILPMRCPGGPHIVSEVAGVTGQDG